MKHKDPLLIPVAIIVAILVVYMLWIDYPGDGGPILIAPIPAPTPTIEPTPTIDTSLDWYCWKNPKSDKCIEFCKRVDCRE